MDDAITSLQQEERRLVRVGPDQCFPVQPAEHRTDRIAFGTLVPRSFGHITKRHLHPDERPGDATIVVSGQVEKPGYLIADLADLPLVDHRGVVSFTNVGELPIEIVGVDAPGLTTAPIPTEVAAGATWELEIAICADTTIEPDLIWTFDGQIGPKYSSQVTVETPTSESTTTVSSFEAVVPLPSCLPVIDPIDIIVMEVSLP